MLGARQKVRAIEPMTIKKLTKNSRANRLLDIFDGSFCAGQRDFTSVCEPQILLDKATQLPFIIYWILGILTLTEISTFRLLNV